MKRCPKCAVTKQFAEFSRNNAAKDGLQGWCKGCVNEAQRAHYQRNREQLLTRYTPEHRREQRLRYQYGLTPATYKALLEAQSGVCDACRRPSTSALVVDHDHACCAGKNSCGQCVRGLLCNDCNIGLGYFKDNTDRLQGAIDYLKKDRTK